MKKIISLLILVSTFLLPAVVFAAPFERNLYYGLVNDQDVSRLQEFLKDEGFYSGPVTGNFFDLTRAAVRKFQEHADIQPISGYVGIKTRTYIDGFITVNPSRAEQILVLTRQIQSLQAQLQLLKQGAGTPAPAPKPPTIIPVPVPSPTPSPSATPTPAPQPASGIQVSGSNTGSLPPSVVSPLKLGDFSFQNNTQDRVNVSQISIQIMEDLNSSLNRGKETFFILRNGSTTADTQISKTSFTISSVSPAQGSKNQYLLSLPYGQIFEVGEKKNLSLWIENLDYVINGSLNVTSTNLLLTSQTSVQGGFSFTLTK